MMKTINLQKQMLIKVAKALGEQLVQEVVFVGGCTTGLLITDDFTKEQIRYTDDVDLIVDVVGYPAWVNLQRQLSKHGFRIDMGQEVLCRMLLGELKVDFMPMDEKAIGYTNKWYKGAVERAQNYQLSDDLIIKLVTPEYFIATKLEAYLGRGNGDCLSSHDIEDLLCIFDGREEIVEEINHAPTDLKDYISDQLTSLLDDDNFQYVIQSLTNSDPDREALIFERLEGVTNNG